MDKSRVGRWLLVSFGGMLALAFTLVLLGLEGIADVLGPLAMLYGIFAVPAGIALTVWGSIETRQRFGESQRYAELHGWHPITSTSWRTMKRGGHALSVSKAYKKSTYILSITLEGEETTVVEFERALWALQFGDWLWEQLAGATTITPTVVYQKQREWNPGLMLPPGR